MRFDFLFTTVFWGVMLILVGVAVIIKAVFNIDIPIVRIVFSLLLIYVGISMLTGFKIFDQAKNTIIFGDCKMKYSQDNKEYNIIFASGEADFRDLLVMKENIYAEVNTVFGRGVIKIKESMPVKVVISSAFSGARMPDGNMTSFGEYIYKTKSFNENSPYIEIHASVVFGGLEVIED